MVNICKICTKEHNGLYGSGKYCSRVCSAKDAGNKNKGRKGKSLYQMLVNKYGKEEADVRYKKIREKTSKTLMGHGFSDASKAKIAAGVRKAYAEDRLVLPGTCTKGNYKVNDFDLSGLEKWLDSKPFDIVSSDSEQTKFNSLDSISNRVEIEPEKTTNIIVDQDLSKTNQKIEVEKEEKKFCACNKCGIKVPKGYKYAHGHNGVGKKKSKEETVRRIATRKINKELREKGLLPPKERRICACNKCGELTEPGKKYRPGHNFRVTREKNFSRKCPNLRNNPKCKGLIWYTHEKDCINTEGKPCRSCFSLAEGNPAYGKPAHPNVVKAGRARKGIKGRKQTAEERKANSERVKKLYADGILVPNGAGHKIGISGIYNGVFSNGDEYKIPFKSTPELDLIIEYEKKGRLQDLVRADQNDVHHVIVIYKDNNTSHPDFKDIRLNHVMEVKELDVESKPWWPEVKMKCEAAMEQLSKLGLTFELVKRREMDKERELYLLREIGRIAFDEKWENQYWDWVFQRELDLDVIV